MFNIGHVDRTHAHVVSLLNTTFSYFGSSPFVSPSLRPSPRAIWGRCDGETKGERTIQNDVRGPARVQYNFRFILLPPFVEPEPRSQLSRLLFLAVMSGVSHSLAHGRGFPQVDLCVPRHEDGSFRRNPFLQVTP
mgnify:CR=1 FL=1